MKSRNPVPIKQKLLWFAPTLILIFLNYQVAMGYFILVNVYGIYLEYFAKEQKET